MRLSLNTTRMLERVERTTMRGQPHGEASNDFVALCMDAQAQIGCWRAAMRGAPTTKHYNRGLSI